MKKKGTALLFLSLTLALSLTACTSGTTNSGGEQENGGAGQNEAEQENGGTVQNETQQENGGAGENEPPQTEGGEAPSQEGGQQAADLEGAESLSNDGLTLSVPAEYRDLLILEAPQNDENGVLFSVSEKASAEAGLKDDPAYEGGGWLFSIARVSREDLNEMLCYDMSGMEVMAKDTDGNYYLYLRPTDVRFVRESYDDIEEDMQQWAALNEWADTQMEAFPAANGLTPERRGNTDLDMCLARIAYLPDTTYTISTTEYGPLEPGDVDPAPYLEKLTQGVLYEDSDGEEAPDGEYVVLNFPEEEIRFDFFLMPGKENYVRQVYGGDVEYERLYHAEFQDDATKAGDVMQTWYDALAAAQGLGG